MGNLQIQILFPSSDYHKNAWYESVPFEIREHDGTLFFVQNGNEKPRKLADGFFLDALRKLDTGDFDSVVDFMSEHGLARSCARIVESARLTSIPRVDNQLWNDRLKTHAKFGSGKLKFADEAKGIELSSKLAETVGTIQTSQKERLIPLVVSFEEASACLKNAQTVCNALMDASLNPELEPHSDRWRLAEESATLLSAVVGKCIKTILVSVVEKPEMGKDPDIVGDRRTLVVPFVAAIYGQFYGALKDGSQGDVFKACPRCGRIFQKGHGFEEYPVKDKNGEIVIEEKYIERKRSTKYCCERCQDAYRSKQYRARKRAAKAKAAE